MDEEEPPRTCPTCDAAVEDDETVIFFGGEMYHLRCAPGAATEPGEPRQPRF